MCSWALTARCVCNVTLLCDNVTELSLTIFEDHHDRTTKILPDATSALLTRVDVKEIKHQKLEKRSVFLLSELSALISLQHRNRITCVRANTLCPRGHPGRSAAYRPLVKDTTLSVTGNRKHDLSRTHDFSWILSIQVPFVVSSGQKYSHSCL